MMEAASRYSSRLDSLDGLRFISCVIIVLYHFVPYIGGKDSHLFWPLRNAAVMVDVFFIISGMVIAHNYSGKVGTTRSFVDFMKRRVARLYPLHLATLLFYAAIGVAVALGYLNVVKEQKYDFGEFIPNLLMVHAWGFSDKLAFNGASWSISAEMFAYLCFPLLVAAMSRSLYAALAALVLIYAVGIVFAEQNVGRHLTALTIPLSIFRAVPSFGLGVLLYIHRKRLPQLEASSIALTCGAAALIFVMSLMLTSNTYIHLAAASAFTAAVFMADQASVPTPLSQSTLVSAANLTYSIYMLHGVIATMCLSFLFPRILGDAYQSLAVRFGAVVLAIALTFALSAASYRWFETPARKAINAMPSWRRIPTPTTLTDI